MREVGPGEGFVGARYLRLYPLETLADANRAYSVVEVLPGHLLFGSDGCGNAFLFRFTPASVRVVEQPFIPFDPEYRIHEHESFSALLQACVAVPAGFVPPAPNPQTLGLEAHERHPIVLGGDPTDPSNKTLLAPTVHAQAVTYFNRLFRDIRSRR